MGVRVVPNEIRDDVWSVSAKVYVEGQSILVAVESIHREGWTCQVRHSGSIATLELVRRGVVFAQTSMRKPDVGFPGGR